MVAGQLAVLGTKDGLCLFDTLLARPVDVVLWYCCRDVVDYFDF